MLAQTRAASADGAQPPQPPDARTSTSPPRSPRTPRRGAGFPRQDSLEAEDLGPGLDAHLETSKVYWLGTFLVTPRSGPAGGAGGSSSSSSSPSGGPFLTPGEQTVLRTALIDTDRSAAATGSDRARAATLGDVRWWERRAPAGATSGTGEKTTSTTRQRKRSSSVGTKKANVDTDCPPGHSRAWNRRALEAVEFRKTATTTASLWNARAGAMLTLAGEMERDNPHVLLRTGGVLGTAGESPNIASAHGTTLWRGTGGP